MIPGLSIGVAHGRMTEDELEEVMVGFYQGDYDVLLSTTIIENGLDVPLANTIIIDGAENFGLSQLYQMRGRVGRSSRLAYAYFLYKRIRPCLKSRKTPSGHPRFYGTWRWLQDCHAGP